MGELKKGFKRGTENMGKKCHRKKGQKTTDTSAKAYFGTARKIRSTKLIEPEFVDTVQK